MFNIREIAPAIADKVESYEAQRKEHMAACTAEDCERCGRVTPASMEASMQAARSALIQCSRDRALRAIPLAFTDASLEAPWLIKLVGANTIATAARSLDQHRAAFVGPPGSGKTSLAVAMFKASVAATHRHDVSRFTYVSAHALAKARSTHQLGEEAPLVEAALSAPLLVLDELGGEDQRHASAVAEVLYERHAEGRRTWVTMGIGPEEVAQRYGGGIARRVFEEAVVFRLARR